MCSKEWGRPSREQIWLLFIIAATCHGDEGADLGSTKMRANRLVIGALFPVFLCIAHSPKPVRILIAKLFRGPSPLATEATFHNFALVASGGRFSGIKSFPNPGKWCNGFIFFTPTDHADDADLRWRSHYSHSRLIPHLNLLRCVFTLLSNSKTIQNFSQPCSPAALISN